MTIVDKRNVRSFASAAAFEAWLSKNHDRKPELWIKIHKKASGLKSITALEAIDVVLCWGWIDGQRKGFDARSFLQRYCPRGKKSIWSQINRRNVARLEAAGKMTKHGRAEVDRAKADGRWAAAYAPMRDATPESVPEDLRRAIAADPTAAATFATLDRANLFSLAFRMGQMKTAAGRSRKVATLVAMLGRGETILPLRKKR